MIPQHHGRHLLPATRPWCKLLPTTVTHLEECGELLVQNWGVVCAWQRGRCQNRWWRWSDIQINVVWRRDVRVRQLVLAARRRSLLSSLSQSRAIMLHATCGFNASCAPLLSMSLTFNFRTSVLSTSVPVSSLSPPVSLSPDPLQKAAFKCSQRRPTQSHRHLDASPGSIHRICCLPQHKLCGDAEKSTRPDTTQGISITSIIPLFWASDGRNA